MTADGYPLRRGEIARSAAWFVITLASTVLFSMSGVAYGATWSDALAFGGSLMTILLAHEMGHFWVARLHGFEVGLPTFLPFPVGFGTLGAVIELRRPPPTRVGLLEMGAAGPLAGAVVAFSILAVSIGWTRPPPAFEPGSELLILNEPWIIHALAWLRGLTVDRYAELHPAALAAWVGCLLTGINLLPIGQLDGGHVFNACLPRLARPASIAGVAALVLAGTVWPGWWVWAAALVLLRGWTPAPVPEGALSRRARAVGVATALLFCVTFIPVPMEPETVRGAIQGAP